MEADLVALLSAIYCLLYGSRIMLQMSSAVDQIGFMRIRPKNRHNLPQKPSKYGVPKGDVSIASLLFTEVKLT